MNEIAQWPYLNDDEKRDILKALDERKHHSSM
jgi:predicted Fe-S protein YdhL (DUF1289 family)